MKKENIEQEKKKLSEENALLKEIFNNTRLGIVIADISQRIKRINPGFTDIFGYIPEEAIGKKIKDLIVPPGSEFEADAVNVRLDNKDNMEYEAVRYKKDGQKIDVICRVSPIFSNNHRVGGFAIYNDVTEKKRDKLELQKAHDQLEKIVKKRTKELRDANKKLKKEIEERKHIEDELRQSEERYRTAIENSNDGVAILQGRRHVYVNQRFAEIYGYGSPDELRGKSLNTTIHPDDLQMVTELSKRRQKGELQGQRYEHKGIKKNGDPVYVEVSAARTIYEGEMASLVYLRDVTDRKRAEQELHKAKETAEIANRAKSEFLANMSHEIRTPLNGVMGVLNLLLSTELDNEQFNLVETGKRSADSLLTVINDVLDFSKIEAGELDLEILDFNLRNAIAEVVEFPAMQAYEKGIEFTYTIDPEVNSLLRGDPGRLRQILLNLTNNAIKFTKNGDVFIKIFPAEETESHTKLRFEVRDTEIGIPENKLDNIFESFKQVDSSTTRKYGGTGLGLSISKQLAALMNGEIGVYNVLGKGSTFWFTAVFEKQPDVEETLLTPPPDIRGKRFLLVDDNWTNLNILKGYLENWGCLCDVADSGEIALFLMKAVSKVNAPFDAAMIDMRMPGMDGAELGRRIKSDTELKDTTMLMLTSLGMRGDISRMEKIGFDAYLTKPVRRSQLYDSIINVFGKKNRTSSQKNFQIITKYTILEEKMSQARILIVEDNIINQKLVLRMIEKSGLKADVTANGREAVKALERFIYDIVLMDVQMPEMDGIEATTIIRNSESKVINHNVPIIAMTAYAMKGDREKCIDAGMNDYIAKPIKPEEMFGTIRKYLISTERDSDTMN